MTDIPKPVLKGPTVWALDKRLCEKTVTYAEFSESNRRINFCCGGLFMYGRNFWFPVLVTFPLLVVPFMFHTYLAFSDLPIGVFVANSFVLAIVLYFFVCVVFCDPGFIPRNTTPVVPTPPKFTTVKHTEEDGTFEYWKWCHTCNIWRPPRSKHCRDSDACTRVFDHYCPWMGNTIGARNHFHFYMFLLTTITFATLLFLETIVILAGWPSKDIGPYFFFGFLIFICMVAAFPTYVFSNLTINISRGLTTNEKWLKRLDYENDDGFCANFCKMECPPSQITFFPSDPSDCVPLTD